ncbi:4243_t:CDS:2 [Gigaspora margarita]|uniref:4243_t:CDS:1 n=1 Tax=Gigaspora margarita TaxID=4874 RepID=A0ABN7UCG3_GIGMA|nr:4243_t:CDS:2 [Gigaspora margarita]
MDKKPGVQDIPLSSGIELGIFEDISLEISSEKDLKEREGLKNRNFERKNWKDFQHFLMLLRTENNFDIVNDKREKIHIKLKELLDVMVRANHSSTFIRSFCEAGLYAKELREFNKEESLESIKNMDEEMTNEIAKLNQNIRDLYRQDLAERLRSDFTKLRLEHEFLNIAETMAPFLHKYLKFPTKELALKALKNLFIKHSFYELLINDFTFNNHNSFRLALQHKGQMRLFNSLNRSIEEESQSIMRRWDGIEELDLMRFKNVAANDKWDPF